MNNKEKFDLYAKLLREWSARMNLVAPSTLNEIETRHFADSAQLAKYLPHDVDIVDFGSGAGFPGVVLAILGWRVVCIESIGKKVAFLTELREKLGLGNLTVYHGRVENYVSALPCENPNLVITARAFAPLDKILGYVRNINCRLFLLKGREIESEIMLAKKHFKFDYQLVPSETGDGFITIIKKYR